MLLRCRGCKKGMAMKLGLGIANVALCYCIGVVKEMTGYLQECT